MEMRRQWLDWSMSCIYLMRQAKIGRLRFKRRLAREASILSILKSCWDARSVSQVANYTWTLSRNLQQQSYYFWLDTLVSLTGFFFRFEFPKPSKDARKVAARLHVFCRCQWVFRWMCKLLHASGPGGRCPNTRHTSQFLRYTRGSWHACLDGPQWTWKPIWWWGQPLCMRSQLYCSWSPSFCMVLFVRVKRCQACRLEKANCLTPTTFS